MNRTPEQEHLLTIATAEVAPETFNVVVDGQTLEFDLFDMRHFDDAQEVEFNRMLARDRRWARRMAKLNLLSLEEDDEAKGEAILQEISDLEVKALEQRVSLLVMMTSMDEATIRKLKSYDKIRLINEAGRLSAEVAKRDNPELEKQLNGDDDNKEDGEVADSKEAAPFLAPPARDNG